MIPIQKNITVIDEQGNIYEATYPKRAKGLIKSGRARFISEDIICLVRPPKVLEEHMSDINSNLSIEEPSAKETNSPKKSEVQQDNKLSMSYVLEQIEKIVSQTEYLGQVIGAVSHLESAENIEEHAVSVLQEKVTALGDVVRCRETTNQQLIRLYEKMYDNIREESI